MKKRFTLICFFLIFPVLVAHADDEKPLILVTNDDGIDSIGLKLLAQEMMKLGEVVVVAPKDNMSGSSHSHVSEGYTSYGKIQYIEGVESYWMDNTPVSCVRWGITSLLRGRRPDLVVSGINIGSNFGMSVIVVPFGNSVISIIKTSHFL